MDLKASKIGVRTVDYAQGSEADVVILSSVSRSFGTITPYSLLLRTSADQGSTSLAQLLSVSRVPSTLQTPSLSLGISQSQAKKIFSQ